MAIKSASFLRLKRSKTSKLADLGSAILIAVWFGLLTGYGETILNLIKRYWMNKFILLSPNSVWMAPLMNAILFSLVAVILWLVGLLWPWFLRLRTTTFVFSTLALLSWLVMYQPLHPLAAVLLSIGVAFQVSLMIQRHNTRFESLVKHSIGWFAGATFILAVSLNWIVR